MKPCDRTRKIPRLERRGTMFLPRRVRPNLAIPSGDLSVYQIARFVHVLVGTVVARMDVK
jgi:hypothetical protein